MGKWSTYRRRGRASPPPVPPPPAPPLDLIATPAFAAYSSARRLRAAYAGPCLRVIRSSDSTTLDIGFDGEGNLDQAALLAFVGGSTGRVDILYDQTTGGRDLTMLGGAGNKPMIVNAGTLITDGGGNAAMQLNAATDNLQWSGSTIIGPPTTYFAITIPDSPITAGRALVSIGTETQQAVRTQAGPVIAIYNGSLLNGESISAGSRYLVTVKFLVGTDSVQLGLTTPTTGTAGDNGATRPSLGAWAASALSRTVEFLIWTADLSAGDVTTLQTNLLSYFD